MARYQQQLDTYDWQIDEELVDQTGSNPLSKRYGQGYEASIVRTPLDTPPYRQYRWRLIRRNPGDWNVEHVDVGLTRTEDEAMAAADRYAGYALAREEEKRRLIGAVRRPVRSYRRSK